MPKKDVYFLVILLIILFGVNYPFLDNSLKKFFQERERGVVERVVDGDTIIVNGERVRMLGINTPEKGEEFSLEAKKFLESLILNKTVELEYGKQKKDRYGRTLGYIFLKGENINLKLVRKGFANYYFPSGKERYYGLFKEGWEMCLETEKNLCERSLDRCSSCIEIEEFDYKNQKIIFRNRCSFSCNLTNWKIKDEGRKNFIFPNFILE